MREHAVELPRDRFEAVRAGTLSFLLLPDAPDYRANDVLILRDGDREVRRTVTYVTSSGNPCALSPDGLAPGWSILSIGREPV